jgi:hypothetical protein
MKGVDIHALKFESAQKLASQLESQHARQIAAYENQDYMSLFPTRAALGAYLLYSAPSKLCDGIWLRGIRVPQEDGESMVVRLLNALYKDEVGHGKLCDNHVFLFQKLMQAVGTGIYRADHGELLDCLPQSAFIEPAVQLALGLLGHDALPEVIGYTLGYEQFAPSLAITRDALRHYDLPADYYSVHLSVDNLDCGHARQIIECLHL